MNIKTKFNLKDRVYPIKKGCYSDFINCKTCREGRVKINNTSRTVLCPDCSGSGGKREWFSTKWDVQLDIIGKIGKISLELYDKEYKNDDRRQYMLDSTGVGSGTLWNEHDLFLTKSEACLECEKRNKITKEMG